MITLKKAFEAQNILRCLQSKVIDFLTTEDILSVRETHYKKSGEEYITKPKQVVLDYSVMDVVDFGKFVSSEIEKLTNEINKAKTGSNYDGLISVNNSKRLLLNAFTKMSQQKDRETEYESTDYVFNAEGNQVRYYYPVSVVKTLDYNRNAIKAIEKNLREECNDRSEQIDKLQLTIEVNYKPIFTASDSFEDALDIYFKNIVK